MTPFRPFVKCNQKALEDFIPSLHSFRIGKSPEAFKRSFIIFPACLESNILSPYRQRGDGRRPRSRERIEYHLPGIRIGPDEILEQRDRLLRRMPPLPSFLPERQHACRIVSFMFILDIYCLPVDAGSSV